MHALFGVEPAAIDNWANMRYLIEKFGMSKGALIAQIPKKWPKLVIEACQRNQNVGDIERARIEEKLRQAKDEKLFRPQHIPYEPDQSWTENVLSEEISSLLHGVITLNDSRSEKCVLVEELSEDLFSSFGQVRVAQTAEDLANVAAFVIAGAEEIILVDPYFEPARRCIKVLKSIVELACSLSDKLRHVYIFSAASKYKKSDQFFDQEYRSELERFDKAGITYHLVRVDDDAVKMDLHTRFLLTSRGGLNYDRGFQEPEDVERRQQLTLVTCLLQSLKDELMAEYAIDNPDLVIAQIVEVET